MMKWKCIAFVTDRGQIYADSEFQTEADAWRIGLGWPDDEEIKWAKKRGFRVVTVTIEELAKVS